MAVCTRLLIVTNEVREVQYSCRNVESLPLTCRNLNAAHQPANSLTHSLSRMHYNSFTWPGQEQSSTGSLAWMAIAISCTIYPLQTWVSVTMPFRLETRRIRQEPSFDESYLGLSEQETRPIHSRGSGQKRKDSNSSRDDRIGEEVVRCHAQVVTVTTKPGNTIFARP
jgi:hypothetical protein